MSVRVKTGIGSVAGEQFVSISEDSVVCSARSLESFMKGTNSRVSILER